MTNFVDEWVEAIIELLENLKEVPKDELNDVLDEGIRRFREKLQSCEKVVNDEVA